MTSGIPTVTIAGVPDPLPEGLHVLDVREEVEWAYGHIEGATHIPLRELPARVDEVPADQTLVVCKIGGRSARAGAGPPPERRGAGGRVPAAARPRRGEPRRRHARLGGRRTADGQRDRKAAPGRVTRATYGARSRERAGQRDLQRRL